MFVEWTNLLMLKGGGWGGSGGRDMLYNNYRYVVKKLTFLTGHVQVLCS